LKHHRTHRRDERAPLTTLAHDIEHNTYKKRQSTCQRGAEVQTDGGIVTHNLLVTVETASFDLKALSVNTEPSNRRLMFNEKPRTMLVNFSNVHLLFVKRPLLSGGKIEHTTRITDLNEQRRKHHQLFPRRAPQTILVIRKPKQMSLPFDVSEFPSMRQVQCGLTTLGVKLQQIRQTKGHNNQTV
jgi:hypothetical protein